jgi:3-hydroxyacyl-[acyl-carrier-protein] dehydratase
VNELEPLRLGADVIHLLIPHRRPLLLVDGVEAFRGGPRPALRATRLVSINEPVFDGHFPGLHLWPGIYTIEGLGQTCNLLIVLLGLQEGYAREGGDSTLVLRALENLDRGFRFAGHDPAMSDALLAQLRGRSRTWNMGMSAAVQIKLHKPVFAGQRLSYEVERTHVHDQIVRFEVRALVEEQVVASGTLTSSLAIPQIPWVPEQEVSR